MKRFGLIGFPVSHSFSKKYFTEKFAKSGLDDHFYDLFELEHIADFPALWSDNEDLSGLNVTVPHKENVLPYLDELDSSAKSVGASNVIKKVGDKLVGYNSDFIAFRHSLASWIGDFNGQALVLGTGGSSKAVCAALKDLTISFKTVSRSKKNGDLSYEDLFNNSSLIDEYHLLINTTPLGMHPKVDTCPQIPYEKINAKHFLFDLVYNPSETLFLQKGRARGAQIKNGDEMLVLQAEKSWEIWNS